MSSAARPGFDASELSPYTHGPQGPLWWGFLGLVTIEAAVFATLIVSFLYLRWGELAWPPAGTEPPELLLPSVNTLVLLASSPVMYWADSGIKRGDQRRLAIGLLGASALGLTFLLLKVVEYSDVSYSWDDNAYGSIVWYIIGFHSAHVLALLLKTAVVDVLAWRGYFNERRRLGVTVNGIYWHFVVAIWIPLYIVLYWVPRLG